MVQHVPLHVSMTEGRCCPVEQTLLLPPQCELLCHTHYHPMAAGEVQYVVLDEADKMLSQGLQPQLKWVRQLVLPKGRKQREPDPEGSPGALLRIPARARPQVTGLPSLCEPAPVPCVKTGHSS